MSEHLLHTILLFLAGPAAIAVALGAVVLWDRLREPHRDPSRPHAVVDHRTYRDGVKRVERLLAAGDGLHAEFVMTAMCLWLRQEVRTGRRSRRVQRASNLEHWELQLEQLRSLTR